MKPFQTTAKLALAGAIVAGAIGVQALQAEEKEKKQEYVSTAEVKTLVKEPLPGIAGKILTILDAKVPPNWLGGRHYHSGPVFVVVQEGAFRIDVDGKPPHTINAGEAYVEPIGTPMLARNPSSSELARFLVIQVTNEGEPLMYKSH